ncbi:hypothetical protein IIA15_01065 [candidate division TA06 bacterium]|nr:hypothetical protein [candidate division TA06 bacterium]
MVIIKDGSTGNTAQVTEDNLLHVLSTQHSLESFQSLEEQNVFLIGTNFLPLTATEGLMLYIDNQSEFDMVLSNIVISWNGGDTNFNRPVFLRFEKGATTPTTNTTSITANNANFSSTKLSGITILEWDGVGTGMTGGVAGTDVDRAISSIGSLPLQIRGVIRVSSGQTLAIHARGEEIGTLVVGSRWIETNKF